VQLTKTPNMLRIVNAISVASRRVPKTLKSKKGLFASIKKTNAPSRSFVTSVYQKEKTKKSTITDIFDWGHSRLE
jgi:hypothetical protein